MCATLNYNFSSHYNFISCITLYFPAGTFNSFLGALKKCKNVTVSFVMAVCPSVCLSVCPSVCPSVRLSVRLSVYPSVCLSICPSVCLSVRPSVCPSVRLSVRPSFRLHETTWFPLEGFHGNLYLNIFRKSVKKVLFISFGRK